MRHNSTTFFAVAHRGFLKGGPYNYNQLCLMEKFFQMIKKGLHFESVPVLSIFLPKIQVTSRKKVFTLNLSRMFRIN